MIGVGLRLVFSGGREAITRLVVLAIAVGLGVGLLLTALAATNAVAAWSNRHAWQWTGTVYVPAPTAGIAPLWWHPSGDTFDGQQIARSTWPPPAPRPRCRRALPATRRPASTTPRPRSPRCSQHPGRPAGRPLPGRLAGTIGDAALPSPNSLVLIVGRTPAQLAATPNSVRVTSIATTVPADTGGAVNPDGAVLQPAQR